MLYSVVIPYYNSQVIHQLCRDLTDFFVVLNVTYEIIIVNDKSDENKKAILNSCEFDFQQVIVYHAEKNYGQDYSTGFGISVSKGKYMISIDDDLEFPVKEIQKLISAVSEFDADVVYGMPSKNKNSIFRKYTRNFYYFLIRISGYNSFGSFRLIHENLREKITLHFTDNKFCIDKLLLLEAKHIMYIYIINQPKEKSRYNKIKLFKKFLLFFIYKY